MVEIYKKYFARDLNHRMVISVIFSTIALTANPMVVWWQHEALLGAARGFGRGGEQGERGAEPDT